MPRSDYSEVEAFLNDRDANRRRRREHHLHIEEYRRTDCAFFLTCCARHHGEPFTDCELAGAVIEALRYRQRACVWQVYAYCVMPDHLHAVLQLLASDDGQLAPTDLLTMMGEFRSFTTRAGWRRGLRGPLWQHDQYDRLLRGDEEFAIRCQYVLDNPVRKGLVEDWTLWPYSGSMAEFDAWRPVAQL